MLISNESGQPLRLLSGSPATSLQTQTLQQPVVPGPRDREGHAQVLATRERQMVQIAKDIEPFRLLSDRLGNQAPGDMRPRDPMSAIAVREVDVVTDTAHVRNAADRQTDVPGPGEFDLCILELREGPQDVWPEFGTNIAGILAAVHRAATEKQSLVSRYTVVVEEIVCILDTVVLGKEALGDLVSQHFGCCDLTAGRQDLGRDFWNQIAEISVAADNQEVGCDGSPVP